MIWRRKRLQARSHAAQGPSPRHRPHAFDFAPTPDVNAVPASQRLQTMSNSKVRP